MTPMRIGACGRERGVPEQPDTDARGEREQGGDRGHRAEPASWRHCGSRDGGARGSDRRRDGRHGRGCRKRGGRVADLRQRHDRGAAQQRLARIAVEHEREPCRGAGALRIPATLGARHAQRLADGSGLEHAPVEGLGERRGVPVADVGERADDGHRAAEEEGVRDARHGRFPLTAGRPLPFARAGARVQEDERASRDVGLDHRRGQRASVGEQERRPRVRAGDDVAAVVDEIESLAEIRRDGLEARQAIDDAHDVGERLEGLADSLDLLAHEGQIAARIRSDDERARPRPHAGRCADEQRAVEDEAFPEAVAKAPELLLVVQELPGQSVQRGADQQRTRDGPQLLPQAWRDQRPVEHLAARLRFLREGEALRAAQQRLGAGEQRARRDVVDRVPEFLLQRLAEVALRHVQAVADRSAGPLDGESRDEPHRAPGGLRRCPAGRLRAPRAADTDPRPSAPRRRRVLGPASSRTDVVSVERT